jgi:hypothetical protein
MHVGEGRRMNGSLVQIDTVLAHIERLAEELQLDPDGSVRRSATELRAAFGARGAIEPAVARMRDSVQVLRRDNQDPSRHECQPQLHGLDQFEQAVEYQLLPHLRRIGFEV